MKHVHEFKAGRSKTTRVCSCGRFENTVTGENPAIKVLGLHTADEKCPFCFGPCDRRTEADELTEAEQARRGELLAEVLDLDNGEDGKYRTEWGRKTELGLYRTVKRIIEEGK